MIPFDEAWAVDFEFRPQGGVEGNRPEPICLVAHELRSGRKIRLWQNEFGPFPSDRWMGIPQGRLNSLKPNVFQTARGINS